MWSEVFEKKIKFFVSKISEHHKSWLENLTTFSSGWKVLEKKILKFENLKFFEKISNNKEVSWNFRQTSSVVENFWLKI